MELFDEILNYIFRSLGTLYLGVAASLAVLWGSRYLSGFFTRHERYPQESRDEGHLYSALIDRVLWYLANTERRVNRGRRSEDYVSGTADSTVRVATHE